MSREVGTAPNKVPAIWFPTIRTGTGTDVFTIRLAESLEKLGVRTLITWLPLRAEYAPWLVPVPDAPAWATIVHANSWLSTRFIPPALPVVVSAHHCVHDPALATYKSWMQKIYHRLWGRWIESRLFQRAAAIVSQSHYSALQFRMSYRIPEPIVIPSGIDLHGVFQPRSLQLPHCPFRLIYIGSWSRRKGVDLFAPIMEALGPKFELRVTSDKPPGERIYSTVANIISIGRPIDQGELALAYGEADALLFPSRLEGFGLAVLEALACGLPVIAARSSALPEVVEDGVTGLLCEQDDVAAFSEAIRQLACDQNKWIEMRIAARHRVEALFGVDTMADEYLKVYAEVLGNPNPE